MATVHCRQTELNINRTKHLISVWLQRYENSFYRCATASTCECRVRRYLPSSVKSAPESHHSSQQYSGKWKNYTAMSPSRSVKSSFLVDYRNHAKLKVGIVADWVDDLDFVIGCLPSGLLIMHRPFRRSPLLQKNIISRL